MHERFADLVYIWILLWFGMAGLSGMPFDTRGWGSFKETDGSCCIVVLKVDAALLGSHTLMRMTSRLLVLVGLCLVGIPLYLITQHSDGFSFTNMVQEPPPDISYGIIMDAGSTGTRLFLYQWTANSDKQLIAIEPALDHAGQPVVKKAFPGLSTFADKPHQAADYIKPLLDYAVEFVPREKRPYTPIFLFATAGMRLVEEKQQAAILSDLHTKLPQMTEMQVIKEHIRVIEGKWEGIYSWIAVNYILGRFSPAPDAAVRLPTVGMSDMGGASMQIAYELPQNDSFRSDAVENVNLGCRDDDPRFKYKLFVTTFLGFGVNEGLRRYEQSLSNAIRENGTAIRDECMPVNLQRTVVREDGTQFMRKGVGDWPGCVERIGALLTEGTGETSCSGSCYLNTVAAPSISLSDLEFYGFSEYWFSVEDVLSLGGEYNYSRISQKASEFCAQRWSTIQSQVRRKLYAKANDDRLRSQCFKSAWVTAVLHSGFGLDKAHNRFKSAFTIAGQEVQWALGAMIYHMRYFPLRDAQVRVAHSTSSDFNPLAALLIVAAVCGLVYVLLSWRSTRQRGMRRENSMWGYMMLPAEDPFKLARQPAYA